MEGWPYKSCSLKRFGPNKLKQTLSHQPTMKGVLFFVFFLLVGLSLFVLAFKQQSSKIDNLAKDMKEHSLASTQSSGSGAVGQVSAPSRSGFPKPPVDSVDDKKFINFFDEAVVKEAAIYRWYKPNLTYCIDLMAQRRLSKSKIRRAFEAWSRKSRIFTFTEVNSPANADIMIKVASASEKTHMGEAGPDQAYAGQTFTLRGRSIPERIVKHAQVTIASDYFDVKQVEQYTKTGNDQGYQTLVHELGHVLGLMGHSPTQGACMYFQADPTGKACDVLTSEVNTLAMIYGRPDLLTRGFYTAKRN